MFSQWPVLFPITNHYQDFYFMIANKFLGAVGLAQMHLIERDSNLGSSVFCFRYMFPRGISFFKK